MPLHEQLTTRLNILLGKNGCGKSTLLRQVEQDLSGNQAWFVRYVTPERGGSLIYNANIEQNSQNDPNWVSSVRRRNRFEQFREQSVSQFRNLEMFVLREIERTPALRADATYTFETVVNDINALLPLVKINRATAGFEIHNKATATRIDAQSISSGESEAIALAIEVLVFSRECQGKQNRLLLLDEPDVHLHPDLQTRYMRFVEKLAKDKDFKVLVATHSTAIAGSILDKANCQLAFMPLRRGADITFSPLNEIVSTVLPMFGAHPLSNAFNESALLLVEGDDDKRIWDQVVRSTSGRVALFPCPTGSIDNISDWESWLVDKLPALYDEPRAFSLRDRDDAQGQLDDRPPVIRFRLICRAAENLICTEESLAVAGVSWDQVVEGCKTWIANYGGHAHFTAMKAFEDSGYDRLNANLKDIRNILLAIAGVSKPWEVLVGQAIASACSGQALPGPHSIKNYLGAKLCVELLRI